MAKMTCPVCKGTGVINEDSTQYEFISRDQISQRCLYCDGSGLVWPRTKLPNGKEAHHLKPERLSMSQRLNVSRKAAINPEKVDTGVGYGKALDMSDQGSGISDQESGVYYDLSSLSPRQRDRLNKMINKRRSFLVVAETEPYYVEVYQMIRKQEKMQGTWSDQDVEAYTSALEREIKRLRDVASECYNTKEVANG